jgi:hypothetical protein
VSDMPPTPSQKRNLIETQLAYYKLEAEHSSIPETRERCQRRYEETLAKKRELDASGELCHCGKPEVDHIWISESELNEWRPQEGFKKNSCARKPGPDHTEGEPELIFKVWSPPENPCDEEYMEEISS